MSDERREAIARVLEFLTVHAFPGPQAVTDHYWTHMLDANSCYKVADALLASGVLGTTPTEPEATDRGEGVLVTQAGSQPLVTDGTATNTWPVRPFPAPSGGEPEATPGYERVLRPVMKRAREEYEHAQGVFAAPHSSHDALCAFHHARGVQEGVGRCFDAFGRRVAPPENAGRRGTWREADDSCAVCDSPDRRVRWMTDEGPCDNDEFHRCPSCDSTDKTVPLTTETWARPEPIPLCADAWHSPVSVPPVTPKEDDE